MDKANIIISIIIVICVAAAVAAYGITNSDNPIFSNLPSMAGNDNPGTGTGNNTTHLNNTGSTATTSGSSGSNSGSGGSSSGSNSGSGSDSGGSSYNNGGSSDNNGGSSSDNGGSSSSTQLSYSSAQSIANGAVSEPGCYAGGGYYSDGYWYFTIYDENGNCTLEELDDSETRWQLRRMREDYRSRAVEIDLIPMSEYK